ncbi:MAG: polysaccharide deacetylase family protein [Roseimicrobium sp.]
MAESKQQSHSSTGLYLRPVVGAWCALLVMLFGADVATAATMPGKEIPRRVLVLHGWEEAQAEKPGGWPVDTMTGELFQTPLEWLGYEVEYLNIGKKPLPVPLPARFAGVLLDGETEIPPAREMEVAEWLLSVRDRGARLLFTGSFPFSRDDVVLKLSAELGFHGSCESVPHTTELGVAKVDGTIMNAETPATARATEFRNLQAPNNARVFISLKARDAENADVRYEPIFLAPWGGMWLEPYIILRASADNYLFYSDPYKFLSAWLAPLGVFPAPDPSTRDGRRIFYSHIDGDGFASFAGFKGHPLCAEIIRDRVLKVFPFPITVSIIEAEIRSLAAGVERDMTYLEGVAKSIFELPNIQAASHSYSHPYIWEPKDPNPGRYDEPCLGMKTNPKYPELRLEQEIRGSVNYINERLLPPGKRCDLFLWSGNTRPGPSALRMVREMGIENLNGGNTIISRLYPGIAGVAPRTMEWDHELQVNASNQNEFMYANGFNGPFYGGFADVIDTFERTETPRRLKPVNAYYHFYSATFVSSLRALEKIHHWVLSQKLHSMTALDFVKMTRDSRETRISEVGPRHWAVQNSGLQRTFRLPGHLGKPDLSKCRGITGYTRHEGQLYVHTVGQPTAEIVLVDEMEKTAPHVFLAESSADAKWDGFSPERLELHAEDLRPVEMRFGGLPPKAACDVTVNAQTSRHTSDAEGYVTLTLPTKTHLILDATRSFHAAIR